MEEIGVVKEVKGSFIRVEMRRTPQCERCGMCIQGADNQTLLLDVENSVNAQPGDRVRLALSGGSIIAASFWVYGMPLIGLVIGSIVGTYGARYVNALEKYFPLIGGFLGLCAGVGISMFVDKQAKKSGKYKPRTIEIIQ